MKNSKHCKPESGNQQNPIVISEDFGSTKCTPTQFNLGSSPSLKSIDPLRTASKLLWLELENIKRIRRLDPIGAARER